MLPLIYTNPVYSVLFWLLYLIWFLREMIRGRQNRKAEGVVQQDRGTMGLLLVMLLTGVWLSIFLPFLLPVATIAWNRPLVCLVGIVLIGLGMILRQYSVWTLGRYFTFAVSTHAGQQVVQHGPYRLIRHPAYAGTLITVLGISLAMTNWASIVVALAGFFIGHLNRIKVEEQVLCVTLGEAYVDYMRHTKMLIPFVL